MINNVKLFFSQMFHFYSDGPYSSLLICFQLYLTLPLPLPFTFFITTALAIEKLGLTSFAWVLYAVVDRVWCRKIKVTVIPKKIILASEKGDLENEKKIVDAHDDDDEEDHFVPSKVTFSVITEIGKEEVEEGFRSASTTGTVVNPYIIKTATYSV
jgi:hypothetical protein